MQVCTRPCSSLQRLGPDGTVHSYDRVHKVGVKKGSSIRVLVAFLAHSLLLFHGQVWGSRVDDFLGVVLGAD